VKTWPALDLTADRAALTLDDPEGRLGAWLDDHPVSAILERPEHSRDTLAWRVFLSTAIARDAALQALGQEASWRVLDAVAVDVPDEEWAQRSQAALTAIRVGRLVVTPPWDASAADAEADAIRAEGLDPIVVTIEPSMGFGTGHHESTRLCLGSLQRQTLTGRSVLDLGTGSGVLAIAAARLGCRQALAVDDDEDALDAARGNITLNAVTATVETRLADLGSTPLPQADVVLGNLTGALLRRQAARIAACVSPAGILILSGFTEDEQLAVTAAFEPLIVSHAYAESGWLALTLQAASPTN
jgi:ribosomal protein L11 methyltransferase